MADLSGFTLFKTSKGWQMSTRLRGEDGWSVRIIDEECAQRLFDRLTDIDAASGNHMISGLPHVLPQANDGSASRVQKFTRG